MYLAWPSQLRALLFELESSDRTPVRICYVHYTTHVKLKLTTKKLYKLMKPYDPHRSKRKEGNNIKYE